MHNFPRSSGSVLPARSHRKSFIFPIPSCKSDWIFSQIFTITLIQFPRSQRNLFEEIFPPPFILQLLFFSPRFVHPNTHIYNWIFLIHGTFIILFPIYFSGQFVRPKIIHITTICIPFKNTGCKVRILWESSLKSIKFNRQSLHELKKLSLEPSVRMFTRTRGMNA